LEKAKITEGGPEENTNCRKNEAKLNCLKKRSQRANTRHIRAKVKWHTYNVKTMIDVLFPAL
jgi:hypothetical protein